MAENNNNSMRSGFDSPVYTAFEKENSTLIDSVNSPLCKHGKGNDEGLTMLYWE